MPELLKGTIDHVLRELEDGNRKHGRRDLGNIIDSMNECQIDIEHIEQVFELMLAQDIIPNEELLNKMLTVVISRGDVFRIVSYFDMLVELMESSEDAQPSHIAVKALELLIGKRNDFLSSYFFIDNCIKYGIEFWNRRLLSLYWHCIDCAYLDVAERIFEGPLTMEQWESDTERIEYVMKLIENARDLPAQLQHLKMASILNKERVIPTTVHELYSSVLMSLLSIKITDIDQNGEAEDAVDDAEDSESVPMVNGDDVVFELLSHWYDSYYITRDLWYQYMVNEHGEMELIDGVVSENVLNEKEIVTVFNVADWTHIEIKTLLVFLILERFGDVLVNDGTVFLNVKIGKEMNCDMEQFAILKEKLTASYGEELKLDVHGNIVQIDLQSWQKCMDSKQGVDTSGSESDDDLYDREVKLIL